MLNISPIAAVQSRIARIAIVALALIAAFALSAASAQAAKLTLSKEVQPAGDQTSFTFKIDWKAIGADQPGPDAKFPPQQVELKGGETQVFDGIHKGEYTISEVTPAGWKVVAINCFENPTDPDTEDRPRTDVPNGSVWLELSSNEDKGCTFVNRKDSTLRVVKTTDPAGSAATFAFTGPGGSFSLAHGGVETLTVEPGAHQVTEQAIAGWTLAGIICDDTDSTTSGSTATANVGVGETVTCTFTNRQVIGLIQTPGAGVSPAVASTPTISPAVNVEGTKARPTPARARLLAPTRCVSRRFTVAVEGGPVRSVTFYANGRRVSTVRARGNQRRFTTTLPAAVAVSKIRARVTFKPGATQRGRTLSTTVRRCSRGAVRPQFTGRYPAPISPRTRWPPGAAPPPPRGTLGLAWKVRRVVVRAAIPPWVRL